MIQSFPKIFAVGTDFVSRLFLDEVEVTEKIDGSQFSFGKVNGEFFMRSKGAQLFEGNPQKMFRKGMDYVLSIESTLHDNTVYYCEILDNPKHNVLVYNRVPRHNIILFGVLSSGKFVSKYEELKKYADDIDIETVPLLFSGKIESPDELKKLLDLESILGSKEIEGKTIKLEGVVVKNYAQPFLLGGQPIPIMMGKYVSEQFKEVHRENWGSEYTARGKWQTFVDSFKTEARWDKAIQHLKEKDELENSPRDIGKLLKEINIDVETEEEENIKNYLYREFKGDILRAATKGFPEWYKEKLLKRAFLDN